MSLAGRRRDVVLLLLLLGCCAYSACRIWLAVQHPAGVWQDTIDYRAVSRHGWLSLALWWGMRAPGVPVMLKLTGSYTTFGIVQGVIGAVAWSTLALTVAHLVRWDWRAVLMGWAVLGFAMSPLVVQWDWSALSESFSLSAAAVACAATLWLIWRFTWPRLAVLGASVLAYVGLRDADIWEVMVVAILLIAVGAYETIRGVAMSPEGITEAIRTRWHRTRRWLLVGVAVLVTTLMAEAGALHAHRNVVNVEHALYVRVFPFPARVAWFSSHGMPDGSLVDQQATATPEPGKKTDARVVGIDLDDAAFTPLRSWFEHQAGATYVLFLLTHPGYDLTAPFASPRLTYNDAEGQLSFYAPPMGHALDAVEDVAVPNRFAIVAFAVIGVAVAARRRLYERPEWKFFALLAVAGLLSMLISWHGDGEEVTRHMLEGDVLVRFAVLALLLFGLLGSSRPRTERRLAHDGAASVPDMPLLAREHAVVGG